VLHDGTRKKSRETQKKIRKSCVPSLGCDNLMSQGSQSLLLRLASLLPLSHRCLLRLHLVAPHHSVGQQRRLTSVFQCHCGSSICGRRRRKRELMEERLCARGVITAVDVRAGVVVAEPSELLQLRRLHSCKASDEHAALEQVRTMRSHCRPWRASATGSGE